MLDTLLSGEVFAFMLVFVRMGGAVMTFPGFGERFVFARVRLAVALALTAVVLPLVRTQIPALPADPTTLAVLIGGEALIGLFIGTTVRLMVSAMHVAGLAISFLSGLSYAQSVDPSQGSQGALLSSFLTMLGILVIFVSGAHALMIAGLRDSYLMFAPGTPPPVADFGQFAVGIVAESFKLGVKLAAPFVVFGMVFYIGLGILQRTMPQIQLFFIAIPLQMALAFGLLMLVLSSMLLVFLQYFEGTAATFLKPV